MYSSTSMQDTHTPIVSERMLVRARVTDLYAMTVHLIRQVHVFVLSLYLGISDGRFTSTLCCCWTLCYW